MQEIAMSRNSKRASLLRIVNDLKRFNEEQLKILIDMAHRVRRAKRQLAEVALQAEQMMLELPDAPGRPKQISISPDLEVTKNPEVVNN